MTVCVAVAVRGENGGHAELAARVADAHVGGAEVVAPLRDAVGLVDNKERDAAGGEEFVEELLLFEALGGDVDELGGAGGDVVFSAVGLAGGDSGVDLFDGEVGVGGVLLLVLHERNEGADDDDWPGQQQGGQLIGETFAGAGGHEAEDALASEDVLEDGALAGAEILDAEALLGEFEDFGPGDVGAGLDGCGAPGASGWLMLWCTGLVRCGRAIGWGGGGTVHAVVCSPVSLA